MYNVFLLGNKNLEKNVNNTQVISYLTMRFTYHSISDNKIIFSDIT